MTPFRLLTVCLTILAVTFSPFPHQQARADDPPPPPTSPVEWHVVQLTVAQAQVWNNTKPADRTQLLQTMINAGNEASLQDVADQLHALADASVDVPPPTAPNGDPLPPPLTLPPGREGQPNDWVPIPGSGDRPVKWKPRFPIPTDTGGQPSASWDKEGHWDADNGKGERVRCLPDGTPVQHYIVVSTPMPEPFLGVEPGTILTGLLIVGIVILIGVIILFPPAAPAAPLLLLAAVPAS